MNLVCVMILWTFLKCIRERTEANNTPIEKDTTKVTETDTPTAVPTAAVHVSAASIDGPVVLDRIMHMNMYIMTCWAYVLYFNTGEEYHIICHLLYIEHTTTAINHEQI